jgi:hypothetical protein
MFSNAIESLEDELVSLKDHTVREIKDIYTYLIHTNARIKLRPRIVQHKGYSTFSVIWRKVFFYDWTQHRAVSFKDIRKARGCHLVPKSRLLFRCRGSEDWEKEYIWEKELGFSRTRKKVALLSRAVSALKQYSAMEPEATPEPSVSAIACLEMQETISTLTEAFKSLKEHTRRTVVEVSGRLAGEGRTGIRPRVGTGKCSGFTVEWVKPNGSDPETGQPVERQVPREGKYSIRRSRLLAHCRDCEEWELEYIWEIEMRFARVRRQVDLLSGAITALKQYTRETE